MVIDRRYHVGHWFVMKWSWLVHLCLLRRSSMFIALITLEKGAPESAMYRRNYMSLLAERTVGCDRGL